MLLRMVLVYQVLNTSSYITASLYITIRELILNCLKLCGIAFSEDYYKMVVCIIWAFVVLYKKVVKRLVFSPFFKNGNMKEFVDYWGPRTSSKEDFVRSVVRSAFYGYCVLPKEGAPNVYLTERWGNTPTQLC